MKRKMKKLLAALACLTLMAAMFAGCGKTEKVTVTFMNGTQTLGTAEAEAGKTLEASAYQAYEALADNKFSGWFKTPTFLEASKVDLTKDTFTEDTTLYGYFESTKMTEDTRVWYIVGASGKGSLAESSWAGSVDDATKAKFELKKTGGAVNEFAITIDLYAGDQYQIICDWQWNDQHGFGYLKEFDGAQMENGGGLSGDTKSSNINVIADGNYTITLTTNPDNAAMDKLSVVRNGDAAAAEEIKVEEPVFTLTDTMGVKVKGSWVSDWSELKDLTKTADGIFEITMTLDAGTEVYFSVFEGDADTGFGLKGENVKDEASLALLDSTYNIKVLEAGTYTFTVDLTAYTVSVTK